MLISFACFLFICHVLLSLFYRCPRLNCSCICYGFDLRGYVPGAVLRLPDSMELFYPRDSDSLTTSSCYMGRIFVDWSGGMSSWLFAFGAFFFWSPWSYIDGFMAYTVFSIIDFRPSFLISSIRRAVTLCFFVLLPV